MEELSFIQQEGEATNTTSAQADIKGTRAGLPANTCCTSELGGTSTRRGCTPEPAAAAALCTLRPSRLRPSLTCLLPPRPHLCSTDRELTSRRRKGAGPCRGPPSGEQGGLLNTIFETDPETPGCSSTRTRAPATRAQAGGWRVLFWRSRTDPTPLMHPTVSGRPPPSAHPQPGPHNDVGQSPGLIRAF